MLRIALWAATLVAAARAAVPAAEWAGSFATPNPIYLWTAQKVNGSYADPAMRIVVIKASGSSKEDLNASLAAGKESLSGNSCAELLAGGTMTPSASASCYNLKFDQDMWQSLYRVDTANVDHLIVIAQHFPTEFEATAHYLKDKVGTDIEPVAEWQATPKPPVPWGTGVGAALLVNLLTLCGVIFLVPGMKALVKRNEKLFRGVTSAFASGALLAAAFYLLLFEATHLIAASGEVEGAITFQWGTITLLGFITSLVADLLCTLVLPPEVAEASPAAAEAASSESATSATKQQHGGAADVESVQVVMGAPGGKKASRSTRVRVLSGVLVGDFMHNLCDGIFMGTAFRFCNGPLAWSVTLATIFHEIAQELSDYLVLTDPAQGALQPPLALLLNGLSGLSVLLGTIIVFSLESIHDPTVGMLLAFGGGVYVQIGASECMPRVFTNADSVKARVCCLASFVVGVTAIGLVLLDHRHCNAGGGHSH